tara:strand:- start:2184 stop:3326 length:1143 start_codon:yes stop_codon:yes gene_type:complete
MVIGCIVLAAGNSSRFDKNKSKMFYKIDGAPIIEFTLNNLLSVFNKRCLYITINKKITKKEKKNLQKYTENPLIIGGSTRHKSLANSLNQIDHRKINHVFVHDAARPNISTKLINQIKKEIITNKYDAVVPYTQIEDTVKQVQNKYRYKTIDRKKLIATQTPQAFKTLTLKNNINNVSSTITDDIQSIEERKSLKIKYILGERNNLKITTKSDLQIFKSYLKKNIRIGNGFDLHRIKKGKLLKLAGIEIRSNYQLIGHSDGDVILHSLIDAILGSIQKGDIGEYFPSTSKKYRGISSRILIDEIINKYKYRTNNIINLDMTIICQHIKLSKYKNRIRKSVSEILDCNIGKINIKAKTTDNIGIIGKSKAIACWVTLLVSR